jgi:hypothetical protein
MMKVLKVHRQLIEVSGHNNVKEIWAVRLENSLTAKHYVVL